MEERGQQETRGAKRRWREVVEDGNSHSLEIGKGRRGSEGKQKECIFFVKLAPENTKDSCGGKKRRSERENKKLY